MSMGNPAGGYTQPYGSSSAANMYGGGFGGGTYDPMLGFGQASGMGTTFNYPNRYSADYTRYAQSGMPFNQPVMGYNSYGQIFAQPQRPPPSFGKGGGGFRPPQPPAMGGKGGGGFQPGYGGFQPGYGYQPPQQPPTMGGKGGPRPINDGVTISYPGGSRTVPRSPERRTNQLGLNNEPSPPLIRSPSVQVPANQTGPVTGGPGATPRPLVGGVPTDFTVGPDSPKPVIFPQIERKFPQVDRNFNPAAGRGPPGDNTDYRPVESNFVGILPNGGLNNDVRFGPSNPYTDDLVMSPVRADRPVIDENIYNSPFGQLIGQPAQQTGGVFASNLNNPAYQQQMAFQQGNSEEATRNRIQRELNDAFTTGQRSGVPLSDLYRQQDELSNKLYGQYGLKPVGLAPMSANRPLVGGGSNAAPFRSAQALLDLPTNSPMPFQEGGQVPPDANMEMMMAETAQPEMAGEYDRLIQMTMQAILGQVESPDEIIQMFIDEFGVDAFRQLRDAVLKQQVPGAQTEGMVNGNGGGMDDQVMGMIGNQRPVAVSPGEYIVPADVVSGLGDGSSQAGADILDELNQAVRMTRTGTTQQPRPLMETLQQ